MRKYIEVGKLLFKAQLMYRFDVIMTAVGTLFRVVFAWILWGAIYQGRDAVAGFGLQAMMSYYVVSSLLVALDLSDGVSFEVSDRIRGGKFTQYMTIPSSPPLHFLSQTLGAAGYYALFSALAAALCTVALRIELAISPDPAAIACGLAMLGSGLVFMASYHFFIGTLAFKFQDVGFFLHMQSALIEFARGAVVPLALLPGAVLGCMKLLPFTYVTYMPAMLITGQADLHEGLWGLGVMLAWTAFMLWTASATYNHLRVRYDGVGA